VKKGETFQRVSPFFMAALRSGQDKVNDTFFFRKRFLYGVSRLTVHY
jgi:hypothetical protein